MKKENMTVKYLKIRNFVKVCERLGRKERRRLEKEREEKNLKKL